MCVYLRLMCVFLGFQSLCKGKDTIYPHSMFSESGIFLFFLLKAGIIRPRRHPAGRYCPHSCEQSRRWPHYAP